MTTYKERVSPTENDAPFAHAVTFVLERLPSLATLQELASSGESLQQTLGNVVWKFSVINGVITMRQDGDSNLPLSFNLHADRQLRTVNACSFSDGTREIGFGIEPFNLAEELKAVKKRIPSKAA